MPSTIVPLATITAILFSLDLSVFSDCKSWKYSKPEILAKLFLSSDRSNAVKQAENARITSLRRLDKELAIATANAQKRIKDALTRRDALVAEVDAQVGAELARAEAELPVQEERIKQVMQQLEADVIAPAESECETMMADAKGAAASIVEQGRSQAEGLQELVTSLKRSGSDAKRLFLLQKLEPLLTMLSDTVQPIEVEEVSLIGERDGQMNLSIATLLRQLQDSTGLRLPNATGQGSTQQQAVSGSDPASNG